jgi:hypothetical protein
MLPPDCAVHRAGVKAKSSIASAHRARAPSEYARNRSATNAARRDPLSSLWKSQPLADFVAVVEWLSELFQIHNPRDAPASGASIEAALKGSFGRATPGWPGRLGRVAACALARGWLGHGASRLYGRLMALATWPG